MASLYAIPGAAGTIQVGTVTTGAPGAAAAVSNSGTPTAAILNFTLPKGDAGTVSAAAAGSATAPGITFATDPNTGIYSPGADQLAISTNSTGRLFVDSSGNVGLGTSSPAQQLHVLGSGSAIRVDNSDAGANVYGDILSVAGGTFSIRSRGGASTHGSVSLNTWDGTNDLTRLFVSSTGNVGIGTTSPGALLHVAGTGRIGASDTSDAVLQVGAGGAGNRNSYVNFVGDTTYSDYGLRIIRNNTGANASTQLLHRGTGNFDLLAQEAAPIVFWTSTTERARIDSSGRLLIGTSSAISNLNLEVASNNLNTSIGVFTYNNGGAPKTLLSRANGTQASPTAVTNGQDLGQHEFRGYDGSGFVVAARIEAEVDGTPGANDMPGRLVFSVTADGASSPTEAMRIKNTRVINFSNAPVYADNAAAKTGGLVDGDVYRTSTGDLKIVYT